MPNAAAIIVKRNPLPGDKSKLIERIAEFGE